MLYLMANTKGHPRGHRVYVFTVGEACIFVNSYMNYIIMKIRHYILYKLYIKTLYKNYYIDSGVIPIVSSGLQSFKQAISSYSAINFLP